MYIYILLALECTFVTCCFKFSLQLNDASQISHLNNGFFRWTRCTCIFKLLRWLKALLQIVHLWRFPVLCTAFICECKLAFLLKYLSSQMLHLKELILKCTCLTCATRLCLWRKDLPHSVQLILSSSDNSSWMLDLWNSSSHFVKYEDWQIVQMWFLIWRWIRWTCLVKAPISLKVLSQTAHGRLPPSPLCLLLWCCLRLFASHRICMFWSFLYWYGCCLCVSSSFPYEKTCVHIPCIHGLVSYHVQSWCV